MSTVAENQPSSVDLIDQWAAVFTKKPLITQGSLNIKQKASSMLELSIGPPKLVRDSGFLEKLERHYDGLLKVPLNLNVDAGETTSKPSLSAVKVSLLSQRNIFNALTPPQEHEEHDTNVYHSKLLEPLVQLARVCMAVGGGALTGLPDEKVDSRLAQFHPKLVSQYTHRGLGCTIPDHTIMSEDEITKLVSIEDKNTSFGNSKCELLERMVMDGSAKGHTDEAKVWQQASLTSL
jgi:hypothetical protein